MVKETHSQKSLRRIFGLYEREILDSIRKGRKKNSSYKDAVIIVANGDDKTGSILVKEIYSEFSSDELWYENQPFIVCGLAKVFKIKSLLYSMNVKAYKKLKQLSGLKVIVSDFDSVEVFSIQV